MTRMVLIVDDDADIRTALGSALVDEGYSVAFARNGAEALTRLESEDAFRTSAVILDVRMPEMNGLEFLSVRSRLAELEAVPVVVMTAASYRAELFDPFKACTFLRKPVRLEDLLAALALPPDGVPAN